MRSKRDGKQVLFCELMERMQIKLYGQFFLSFFFFLDLSCRPPFRGADVIDYKKQGIENKNAVLMGLCG